MSRLALLPALLLLIACETEPYEPTCADEPPGTAADAPTWHGDVQPIVAAKCGSCHAPGGIAPFDLTEAAQAVEWAPVIRNSVESGSMPPFGPTNCGECGTWKDARELTPDEKATLLSWIDDGTPLGDPASEPAAPPELPSLPRVDAEFDLGVDYAPSRTVADDYRCFVVDAPVAQDSFVTGFEVAPGDPEVVHHVIVYVAHTEEQIEQAERRDAEEAGPGYACFGGSGVAGAPSVALWAPGVGATQFPEGTGLPLAAGSKAIVQVHYHAIAGEDRTDRTTIRLRLETEVEKEAFFSGPGDYSFRLRPGQEEAVVQTTQDSLVPDGGSVRLWGVVPHMHRLGTSIRVTADGPQGEQCLVDVPDWDFDWQGLYFYEEPITLVGGSTLTLTCRWDTRSAREVVTYGEGTEDEMCLAYFYVTWEGFEER